MPVKERLRDCEGVFNELRIRNIHVLHAFQYKGLTAIRTQCSDGGRSKYPRLSIDKGIAHIEVRSRHFHGSDDHLLALCCEAITIICIIRG